MLKTLIGKSRALLCADASKPVFVIGTGRSGTHWLGHALESHSEVYATIEVDPMFKLVKKMALNPGRERALFWRLVMHYRRHIMRAWPRLYLDKSHPNIWLAEKLAVQFPKARFVAIEREPYATVASMMRHKGVAAWHRRWQEFPIPNRFLGISTEQAREYDSYALSRQCAMRWLAHHRRLRELQTVLGDRMLLVSYEEFAHGTDEVLRELEGFLGLTQPLPRPEVKRESLDKWRAVLSEDDLEQVYSVVGFYPAQT